MTSTKNYFEFGWNNHTRAGLHDDAVCALALAWEYGAGRMGIPRGAVASAPLPRLGERRSPMKGIGQRRNVRV